MFYLPSVFHEILEAHDPVLVGLGFEQLQIDLNADVGEERNARAEENGLDRHTYLIDQTLPQQRRGQNSAAKQPDVFAAFVLQTPDKFARVVRNYLHARVRTLLHSA